MSFSVVRERERERDRVSVGKRAEQKFYMKRSNVKKLNDEAVKE
jgi:hypothetical protein